jgi:hypothetical protein
MRRQGNNHREKNAKHVVDSDLRTERSACNGAGDESIRVAWLGLKRVRVSGPFTALFLVRPPFYGGSNDDRNVLFSASFTRLSKFAASANG